MTRKSTLGPLSVAVITHLRAQGACTVTQLLDHLSAEARTPLIKRLNNLVALGWLDIGHNEVECKTWLIHPGARAVHLHTATPAAPCQPEVNQATPKPAPRYASPALAGRTPPRQYDVMHGDPYVPGPAPVLRPGALAYKACASVGYRC